MSQVSKKSIEATKGDESLKLSETSITAYPSSEILAGYNKVNEGFADRLISMAEKEQEARIEREKSKIQISNKRENTTRLGIGIGALLALCICGISVYTISLGHIVVGAGILASTPIISLVSVFVLGRKSGLLDDKKEEK